MSLKKLLILAVVVCLGVGGLRVGAQAGGGGNPATTPKDRLDQDWWAKRHEAILAQIKRDSSVGLILVGDSITQNYEKSKSPDENFQPTWQEFYAPRKALNLGYSGDATQNVLWRLDHGEVDGIHPAAAIVLIGTNNTGNLKESAEETEAGIDAVVEKLEAKLAETRILLLGILPSAVTDRAVEANLEINKHLAARYGPATGTAESRVSYLDVGAIFSKDGKLDEAIFYDPRLPQHGKPLHPDTAGQHKMAAAIEPMLVHLLGDGTRQYLGSLREVNSALIPVPKLEKDGYDWYQRHAQIVELQAKMDPEIVMIGDSITHYWAGEPHDDRAAGKQAWADTFGSHRVLNMGFGWDRTQNVLWRLREGEFVGIHPRVVVINIGTNNLTATENSRSNTPEEVVEGILAIRDEVRRRSPESRIVVMGIFPRGYGAANWYRAPILAVNTLLVKALAKELNTTFLDIGSKFLNPDGTLPVAMMDDGTHPTEAGYQVWGRALVEAGVTK